MDPSTADYSIPGLRIEFDPAEPDSLTIRAREPMERWEAHSERLEDKLAPRDVEATILYGGRAWRIEARAQGEARWTYRLGPWPEGELQRRKVRLDRGAWLAERDAVAAEAREPGRTARSVAYDFALGWLPARAQAALGERWRFAPEDATRRQAFAQMMAGMVVCILFAIALLVTALGGGGSAPVPPLVAVTFIGLTFDGFVRWAHVTAGGGACGLAPLEALDRVGTWAWRRRRGGPGAGAVAPASTARPPGALDMHPLAQPVPNEDSTQSHGEHEDVARSPRSV